VTRGGGDQGSLDAHRVEAETGWRVVARAEVGSTSDLAATLRDAGAERVAVVADRQTAGRGRGGARFESPQGGLYASLVVLVPVARLPAALVAAVGVALAEAVEEAAPGVVAKLKWPNDLLVAGKKAGGILVEASYAGTAEGAVRAVVGLGVNLARVPAGLPPEVEATALDAHARRAVTREALLSALLPRVATRVDALASDEGTADVERAWRERLAWRGERVRLRIAGGERTGVLVDADLARGLALASPGRAPSWLPMAHVREVRLERP
jgi:BirA family biotin operon repressor/biotin-[acetyl-CoA-carboxylase] ligase